MPNVKGYKLYVRLSPSQARRRLKGYGFGVRKVASAGTGRALIIHTATGEHRRRLHGLFGDLAEGDLPDDTIDTDETEVD